MIESCQRLIILPKIEVGIAQVDLQQRIIGRERHRLL